MSTVLSEVVTALLAEHADRTAVADTHGRLSYRDLDQAAAEFTAAFESWWPAPADAAGPRGDARPRVVISSANSTRYVAAYLGLLRAGAVPFLLDPALGAAEVSAVVESCGIDAVVHDRPLPVQFGEPAGLPTEGLTITRTALEAGWPQRPELLDTTEVCRFTSGSTGTPSCIEFAGTAVRNAAQSWHDATGVTGQDRILCFAGLFNGLAFNTSLLTSFLAGAALWLPSGLPTSGQVIRFLREVGPTRLTGFPALYESIVRRAEPIPELRELKVALSSAAPLKPETAETLQSVHGLAVCNYYGIAETGPLTFDPSPAPDRGQGRPLPGVEFAFAQPAQDADSGEILVRSTSMGSRYLNAPGAFEARLNGEGFYATGDLGLLRDGNLHLTGRVSGRLNLAGRKIDAAEVRAALLAAGATEAVVFAAEKRNGDPMLAAVASGPAGLTEEALRGYCRERFAAYKVPERIAIVDAIPATGVGKPRLEAARELFRQATESALTP
jgi:acyl-CoA synthetase (AMP-forming)/AMP-acid ligase II